MGYRQPWGLGGTNNPHGLLRRLVREDPAKHPYPATITQPKTNPWQKNQKGFICPAVLRHAATSNHNSGLGKLSGIY